MAAETLSGRMRHPAVKSWFFPASRDIYPFGKPEKDSEGRSLNLALGATAKHLGAYSICSS